MSADIVFLHAFLESFFNPQMSGILFKGFETIMQLIETYRDLVWLFGGALFVVSIILMVFPQARGLLGSWF